MAEDAGRTLIFTVTKEHDYYYRKFTVTNVQVYVLQKPIVTKPTDVSYTIEITVFSAPSKNAKLTIEKEIAFSITPTVDDRDLDRSFNQYIDEHLYNIEGHEKILNDKWNAPTAKINYVSAFHQLIKRLQTKAVAREQSENPHIGRKKKLK